MRSFSSGPDGDHPVGEIRRKCIEPGVNNCQRGSMGNFDHYVCGNNVRGAGEACRRQGIAFLPMVVESFGGWHEVSGPNISPVHNVPVVN